MTDLSPRLFTTDAEIEHLGEGLLACTVTREEWTHEAHLAATTYLLLCRRDIDLDVELPDIIRRFMACWCHRWGAATGRCASTAASDCSPWKRGVAMSKPTCRRCREHALWSLKSRTARPLLRL
jgi:hypothetical protein